MRSAFARQPVATLTFLTVATALLGLAASLLELRLLIH